MSLVQHTAILTDGHDSWSWLHFELFSYIRLDNVPIMQRKSVFMLEYLAQNQSSPNLNEAKTHFLYMSPNLLSLWWLRKKKAFKKNVNPLEKYSFLFMVHLIFEVFWAQRPRGYHLFEMHIVQFNMLLGTLVSKQAQTKKPRETERKCKMEFCNIQFTNGVIKRTPSSLHPQNSSVHTHKYRGERLLWCLFSDGKEKNRREGVHRHSSELNVFFKVELNFVQNPPGGRHYWKPFPLKMSAAPPLAWLSLAYIWPAFVRRRLGPQLEGEVGLGGWCWVAVMVCVLCMCGWYTR